MDTRTYARLDATAAAEAVRERHITPSELVEGALTVIDQAEPALNACTVVFADEARSKARTAERRLAEGNQLPPLFGVPVAVKDVIWIKGAPATFGTHALAGYVPDEDAVSVQRLLRAGAIIIAKTTNPPFCSDSYTADGLSGITRNPWNVERSPGFSSGGSGAAVAAGMVPLALGTDAGGSIRVPAAWSGIAGLKPTHGLIPRGPCFEEMRTLNCIGPMARSARDIALALNVLAGPDPADPLSIPATSTDWIRALDEPDPRLLRVAWSVDYGGSVEVDQSVRTKFAEALEKLVNAGWDLQEAYPDVPPVWPITARLQERGSLPEIREHLIEAEYKADWDAAKRYLARDYETAQLERGKYARSWGEFFCDYDLVLSPTTPCTAFAYPDETSPINGHQIGPEDKWWGLSVPANLLGAPAISVPMGLGSDRMPLGIQAMAPRFHDARCIAAAAFLESIFGVPLRAPALG